MISLCITGHSAAAIAAAQAALTAAGMAPARGLERDSHINFSSWHERVYQALEQSQPEPGEDDDSTPDAAPATMGRLWEQLANDLFLANIDAKVWGWADAKSLGLLDFWLELDASTHFVLLATPPEQFLTAHLAQLAQEPGRSLQDLPIDSLMEQWQQAHQTMLHFALHHPKRCVLLLAELPLPADALVQAVKGAWVRKLKALRAEPADATALEPLSGTDSAAALLRHFAAELCQAYPQAQSLQHEMASVALALPAPAIGAAQTLLDSVLSTVSLASQVPALLRQVPALERKAAEAEQQLPRIKVAEEDGELLLAQLHQVQEELERYYLRNTELEAELQAKAQEHEEVSALVHARNLATLARDSEAQAKAEALEQLKVLAQKHEALAAEREAEALAKTQALQEIDSLVHARNLVAVARHEERAQFLAALDQHQLPRLKDAEEKGELLLAQLHQVQEELKRLPDLERKAAEAEQQLLRLKDAEEEGELLLAQLHQVQEELERYYLDNKDLQASLRQAQARFGRIVSRQPDGIDCVSVQTQPLTVGGKPALRCTAVNVAVMGKEWKTLDFFAFMHDGVLSFSFARGEDASGKGPLTRWPRTAAELPALTLRVGQDAYDEPNLNTLKELSTSDWDLLRGLPRLVSQGLQSAPGPWPVGQLRVEQWQDAVQATPSALNDLPVALRHNAFNIQGATSLPGYENLQIQLSHLNLGEKRFENFEFRFACNLGTQGEFGLNARLEFFKLNGAPVFEQWAPNYRDSHRERLDLVFVFPSTLNLKEFSGLSINDRALVLLLADLLPSLLTDTSPNGLALNRPLADWIGLAEKLHSFVRARLDVTGVQKQPGALVDAVSGPTASPESDVSLAAKRRSVLRSVKRAPLPITEAAPKAVPMRLKLRQR